MARAAIDERVPADMRVLLARLRFVLLFVSEVYGRILGERGCEAIRPYGDQRMAEPMPGKYKNKHQKLTYRIDQYVHDLVDEAELSRGTLTIEQKIALINALGKWVAIKNKLIDAMEGEMLDDFRARLKQSDALRGETGAPHVQRFDYEQKSRAGRKGMARRWGRPDPESFDGTGEQLSEFKKRLPRSDDGG